MGTAQTSMLNYWTDSVDLHADARKHLGEAVGGKKETVTNAMIQAVSSCRPDQGQRNP